MLTQPISTGLFKESPIALEQLHTLEIWHPPLMDKLFVPQLETLTISNGSSQFTDPWPTHIPTWPRLKQLSLFHLSVDLIMSHIKVLFRANPTVTSLELELASDTNAILLLVAYQGPCASITPHSVAGLGGSGVLSSSSSESLPVLPCCLSLKPCALE